MVGLMKNILLFKISYFSEPFDDSNNKIKVELDLSNYATTIQINANPSKLICHNLLKMLI